MGVDAGDWDVAVRVGISQVKAPMARQDGLSVCEFGEYPTLLGTGYVLHLRAAGIVMEKFGPVAHERDVPGRLDIAKSPLLPAASLIV